MAFQIRVKYEYQDLLALNQVVGKAFFRAATLTFRMIGFVIGGLMTAGAILVFALIGFSGVWLFNLFIGMALLLRAIFHNRLNARRSKKMMVQQAGDLLFTFDESGFSEQSSLGDTRRPYESVYAVCYSAGRYFLFLDKRHAYILPEDRFIQGSPEAFGPFLEEKCGRPIRLVR